MKKSTAVSSPKILAKFSAALRQGVREWLDGVSRKELPGRAQLGKNGAPKTYRAVIIEVLGVKDWPSAVKVRREARKQAKQVAKRATEAANAAA